MEKKKNFKKKNMAISWELFNFFEWNISLKHNNYVHLYDSNKKPYFLRKKG